MIEVGSLALGIGFVVISVLIGGSFFSFVEIMRGAMDGTFPLEFTLLNYGFGYGILTAVIAVIVGNVSDNSPNLQADHLSTVDIWRFITVAISGGFVGVGLLLSIQASRILGQLAVAIALAVGAVESTYIAFGLNPSGNIGLTTGAVAFLVLAIIASFLANKFRTEKKVIPVDLPIQLEDTFDGVGGSNVDDVDDGDAVSDIFDDDINPDEVVVRMNPLPNIENLSELDSIEIKEVNAIDASNTKVETVVIEENLNVGTSPEEIKFMVLQNVITSEIGIRDLGSSSISKMDDLQNNVFDNNFENEDAKDTFVKEEINPNMEISNVVTEIPIPSPNTSVINEKDPSADDGHFIDNVDDIDDTRLDDDSLQYCESSKIRTRTLTPVKPLARVLTRFMGAGPADRKQDVGRDDGRFYGGVVSLIAGLCLGVLGFGIGLAGLKKTGGMTQNDLLLIFGLGHMVGTSSACAILLLWKSRGMVGPNLLSQYWHMSFRNHMCGILCGLWNGTTYVFLFQSLPTVPGVVVVGLFQIQPVVVLIWAIFKWKEYVNSNWKSWLFVIFTIIFFCVSAFLFAIQLFIN